MADAGRGCADANAYWKYHGELTLHTLGWGILREICRGALPAAISGKGEIS